MKNTCRFKMTESDTLVLYTIYFDLNKIFIIFNFTNFPLLKKDLIYKNILNIFTVYDFEA